MTSQLKAKLLQHFAGKKANGGFTLIELLVVIIIIGILSAIALPSFLNQANKAKQSEAKTYIGSINRAQQAYFMENNTMATDERFAQLGLGIQQTTDNYQYNVVTTGADPQFAFAKAQPSGALKTYAGGVESTTIGTGVNIESTTIAVLCEALLPANATGAIDGTATAPGTYFVALDGTDSSGTALGCVAADFKKL
ncbi:MAG: type IV pilin-like G/H family protein [Cyanobacteria bacterium J06648_10]